MTSVDPSTSSTPPASATLVYRPRRPVRSAYTQGTPSPSFRGCGLRRRRGAATGSRHSALPGAGVDARAARRCRAAGRPGALGAAAVACAPDDDAARAAPAHRRRAIPRPAAPKRARRAADAAGQAAHRGGRDRHGDRPAARAGGGDHLPRERLDRARPGGGRSDRDHVAGRPGPPAAGDPAPHCVDRRWCPGRRAGRDPTAAPALRALGGGFRRRRHRLRGRVGSPAARQARRPGPPDPCQST